MLLTLAATTPWPNVPALVAVEQLSAVIVPTGKATVLVRVQVFPPMLSAKLAVPVVAGVPVMVYVKLPAPIAKLPAAKVAVRPVTPVEVTVCPLCVPPFPPVYGMLLLTLEAGTAKVKVPLLVALAQVKAVMVPMGAATVITRAHVCPPMLSAKLAVPPLAGAPVIVYVKLPAPLAKLPAANVAVSPVTPVELTVCPLCKPPFPPVYSILLLTIAAAMP